MQSRALTMVPFLERLLSVIVSMEMGYYNDALSLITGLRFHATGNRELDMTAQRIVETLKDYLEEEAVRL